MPPSKDFNNKNHFVRSFSHNETTNQARVYHPATNLMPPTPPVSPTGMSPGFPSFTRANGQSWGKPNSQNGGKYA